jgi:diacylglycerol O-acyltransferase / wax synthase
MAAEIDLTDEAAWAIAGSWGRAKEMSPFEALMWRTEADPRLRSTVTAVYLLDRAPDWERLVEAHEWATRLIPRARQKVVEPPLQLGPPTWVPDPDFDLDLHLRRLPAPRPGTLEAALRLAEELAMAPFDRTRPPWEALLIEGLEDGRAAYVFKVSHSVTDGLGGIQLLMAVHSRRREPTPDKPMPEPAAPEPASPLAVLGGQLRRGLVRLPGESLNRLGRTAAIARQVLTHPGDAVAEAAEFGRSLQRMLTPPPAEPSSLLGGRGLTWRFGSLEVGLDEIKRAGKAAGGTVGDAYVAALLGGFRRYHERFGVSIDELPMALPISLRQGDHPMGGNRFAGARFAAPVGEADPAERIRLVHDFVVSAREEPALDALGLLAPVLVRVPTPLLTRWYLGQSSRLDLQASNVPGLPFDIYMAGARIERIYPFGPLPGCAVMAGMLSHNGVCCIGINMDTAAVTDSEGFMECLREGLDEVLALDCSETSDQPGQLSSAST